MRSVCYAVATAFAALAAMATPAAALNVHVINDSGQAPQSVYLMLDGGSSSDGQLPDDIPEPLSQVNASTFSLASISAGRLYVSFGAPVKNNEPPAAATRYDKIELTDPGVANLTAVDFFGIPFDMQALDGAGATVGDALTYRCHTSTILPRLRAIAPAAEVTSGGQFVRFLSPQLSPASYPSMAPYVQSMVGQTIEINEEFTGRAATEGKPGVPAQMVDYSGTFESNGSITLSGTLANPPGSTPLSGEPVRVQGSTLPSAIYTGNGEFTVGGKPADVSENNQYSIIYRDLVAGFALGYWGGRYGNDSAAWKGQPDFAAARAGSAPFATYNEYAQTIGEYSNAYGYSFNDLGPTPVTVPLDESIATLQITIDPDQGPSTPGCAGEATPGAQTPAHPAPGRAPSTSSGRVAVTVKSASVKLDKRGRALLTLACSGDPCKGELALQYVHFIAVKPGRRGRAHKAAANRRRQIRRAVTVVLGHAEFSIAEGRSQRIWVTISPAGRRMIQRARGHRLAISAIASVGPRSRPTVVEHRRVTLASYTPPPRRRRERHGRRTVARLLPGYALSLQAFSVSVAGLGI
jgi:hypothetical protein